MEISEVRVYPVKDGGNLKATAAITFANSFVVREIKVVDGAHGLFVSMPSKKKPDGTYFDIAHPISQEVREVIHNAVLDAYMLQQDFA